jgi:hypothetical protein
MNKDDIIISLLKGIEKNSLNSGGNGNIQLDKSDLAKQGTNDNATNTAILDAVGNINLDKSDLAKQGENQEATNSAILSAIGNVATALTDINETLGTL